MGTKSQNCKNFESQKFFENFADEIDCHLAHFWLSWTTILKMSLRNKISLFEAKLLHLVVSKLKFWAFLREI